MIHYGMTRDEFARKVGKHPSCFENRLRALCRNGNFHALTTRTVAEVNCPVCLEQMTKEHIK